MNAKVITIGEDPDPEQRLRNKWAANLADHLRAHGIERKELAHLLNERGMKVSRQAVDCWLAGEYAPRPIMQAHIAAILRVPAHSLFPIELVA